MTYQQWHSDPRHYQLVYLRRKTSFSLVFNWSNHPWSFVEAWHVLSFVRLRINVRQSVLLFWGFCHKMNAHSQLAAIWTSKLGLNCKRCKLSWVNHILDSSCFGGLCARFAGCIYIPLSCVLTDFSEPDALVACYKYFGTADASARWCNPLFESHVFLKTLLGTEDGAVGAACWICWTRYWDLWTLDLALGILERTLLDAYTTLLLDCIKFFWWYVQSLKTPYCVNGFVEWWCSRSGQRHCSNLRWSYTCFVCGQLSQSAFFFVISELISCPMGHHQSLNLDLQAGCSPEIQEWLVVLALMVDFASKWALKKMSEVQSPQ